MTYAEMRNRLGDHGIHEDMEWDAPAGTRTFRKVMMGLGTPGYYTLRYRGDTATVYPPTLAHIAATFHLPPEALAE
ncbi:MAG: hypothetical protein WD749_05100 [Phycisphaerales bacterium]